MRHINRVYTQRFNRRHLLDGQLFRGRYKAILVEEDSYLLELVRYVHRNSLRAGVQYLPLQFSQQCGREDEGKDSPESAIAETY